MTSPMRIAVVVSVATLFLTPSVFAQGTSQTSSAPSQADFDTCNQQAKVQASSPSAAPRPRTGPMITGPGTPEAGTQGAPGPSSPSGTTAGTATSGAADDRAQSSGGAQSVKAPAESGQAPSGTAVGGSKDVRITGSDIPGTREAGLTGIAAAGQNDVAYQQAYRDCMKSRGF